MRSLTAASVAATWVAVGKVSLEDWPMFTWSLGCSSTPFCLARDAMTSLVFMLEEVPEPVWKTSIGNSASYLPVAISLPAAMMASAISPSSAPESLRSEEHTSELQSRGHLVCRLLLEKKKLAERIYRTVARDGVHGN